MPRRKAPTIRAGTEFGNYKIEKPLGAGGMGHVYLATQNPLGRKVALKFLSPELVAEPEMLRRLLEEAKMASALNHPNILTIHEIGERNGQHYIASEYVDGQTLRSALNKGEVDVQGAIDIVCQILSALTSAHAAGIVHRDLKPGNVMVRSDGYVKVIDFGLAKRTRNPLIDDAEDELSLTRPGAVVGTVFYMSPEQACGDKIDHRTDIWSLGIILFETITRRRPFEGDSDNRVIVNICSKPTPVIPNAAELPSGLLAVMERALEKDPDDRYPTAREMLEALSTVGVGTDSRSVTRPAVLRPAASQRRFFVPFIAVLTILVGVALWLAIRTLHRGPDWFQIDKVRQLTFNGRVLSSAISPDGKYLAYVSGDPEGLQTIYLMQVNGASEVVKVPARNTKYLGLTFAPDDQLFAVAKNRDDLVGRLYEIPVVGDAPPKPVITDIDGPVAFSPNGERMAFVRNTPAAGPAHNQTKGSIIVMDRGGPIKGQPLFSTTEFTVSRYLAWSPRGDEVAAVLFSFSRDRSGRMVLARLHFGGKTEYVDLPKWQIIGNIAWDSNRQSLFTTSAESRETAVQAQIRQVSLQGREVHDLTRDLAGYQSVSVAQGDQLAVVKAESKASLWVSEKNDFAHGNSSSAELERRPNLSWFSPGQLIVGSLRGGFPNLWLFNAGDQSRTPLTKEDSAEEEAVCVPGHHAVVFTSRRSGQAKLWLYDTDENQYRQLTFGPNADHAPAASPDGKWVVFTSASSITTHLFRIPINGGTPEQVVSSPAQSPLISPDGKRILCLMQNDISKTWSMAVLSLDSPGRVQKLSGVGLPAIWSPKANEVSAVFTDNRGTSNIWNVDLNNGKRRQITSFVDQSVVKLAWSPGGERLACLRSSSTSDVVLFARKDR